MAKTLDKLTRITEKSAQILATCYDRALQNEYSEKDAKRVALLGLEERNQKGSVGFWEGQRLRIERRSTKGGRFGPELYDRLMEDHPAVKPCKSWTELGIILFGDVFKYMTRWDEDRNVFNMTGWDQ